MPLGADGRAEAVDLDAVETVLGHTFTDPGDALIALDTSRRGFSRLEFLGDAIIGLSVFAAAECAGLDRPTAIHAVSNRHFDELFHERFAAHCRANTGDVIEALVAAVYLDAGFERAMEVGLTLCLPGVAHPGPAAPRRLDGLAPAGLRFVGASAISAVVADRLCRTEPGRTHRWFAERRVELICNRSLAAASRRAGLADDGDGDGPNADARAADRIETVAGERFLVAGWDRTRAEVTRLLALED